MKLQHLIIIFILIILPITIVMSQYINTQTEIMRTERLYDSRLVNATNDAMNAFKINTINTMYYTAENRVTNMEAAAKTFLKSLALSFNYTGTQAKIMQEYVPAVVLTQYDGYYIYSPYMNTIPNTSDKDLEEEYGENDLRTGLKPFVSYTCTYNYDSKKIMITYSLDNYVVIDVFDGSNHESRSGYLISGITKSGNSYTYDGVTFTEGTTECLHEYLRGNFFTGTLWNNGTFANIKNVTQTNGREYYYTVIDGTKYYYIGNNPNSSHGGPNDRIMYINESGYFTTQIGERQYNQEEFDKYYEKIFRNNSAYEYYKDSYELTNWVRNNLAGLVVSNNDAEYDGYTLTDVGNIFDESIPLQDSNSNFNMHRADVIRATIETNLKTAISGFSKYSNTNEGFIMPKISESDWDLLENNVCMATFFQGIRIAGKLYNNYDVSVASVNKEYVDENDIYILMNDNTYTVPNDSSLSD